MGAKGHFWGYALRGIAIVATGVGALVGAAGAQDYGDQRDSGYGRDARGGGYGQDLYDRGNGGYGRGGQDRGGQDGGYGRGGHEGNGRSSGGRPTTPRCQELERQLASDGRGVSQDDLRRIDDDLRAADRAHQRMKAEADRGNCYEDMFIFGRSLKRTPRCIELDRQAEQAHQRLTQLQHQRESYGASSGSRRTRQEDLVGELARNGCGDNYTRQAEANREASRRSSSPFSFWEDEGAPATPREEVNRPPTTVTPYDSYRTMCVRLCDGYYFPVSYSASPNHFKDDETKCRDQCSAPAELYIYRTQGEEIEQMASLNGKRYSDLPTAFLNRKRYIRGCSCKTDEYSVDEIAKSEQSYKEASTSKRTGGKPAVKAKGASGDAAAPPAAEGEGSDAAPDASGGAGRPSDSKGQKNGGQPGREGALSTPSGEKVTQNTQSPR
jgi:hypothetical protein